MVFQYIPSANRKDQMISNIYKKRSAVDKVYLRLSGSFGSKHPFSSALILPVLIMFMGQGCSKHISPEPEFQAWTNAPAEFSIGIITGTTPFDTAASVTNLIKPTLSGADVTGLAGWFVADPFLFKAENRWYMFMEVCDGAKHKGMIGVAQSADGLEWKYDRIVLEQPYHLSFPYVFEWKGQYYMLPEGARGGALRLYISHNFPYDWEEIAVLTKEDVVDNTLFRHGGRWWLFASSHDARTLRLFTSDKLTEGWNEHPQSPVIPDNRESARLGGPVFSADGKLYRVAQDCLAKYGDKIRVYEILNLTADQYSEKEIDESPILEGGDVPWAEDGIHQFDPRPLDSSSNRWVAVMDGHGKVQPEHILDVKFDNGARLGGVTIRPQQAVRGGTYLLRFYWDIPVSITNPPTMFVHFKNGDDYMFQNDHKIRPGLRPVYEVYGTVPQDAPVGSYEIWCGLYDPTNAVRFSLSSQLKHDNNRVLLPAEITVSPADH